MLLLPCRVFLELLCLSVVRLCVDIVMFIDFSFVLCQDLCHSKASAKCNTRSLFAWKSRTPKHRASAIKHRTIQKDGVRNALDTVCVSLLLSATLGGNSFVDLHGLNAIYCPRMEVYHNRCLHELVFKPVPLLLEDQRSKASSERHYQAVLLFVQVEFPYVHRW